MKKLKYIVFDVAGLQVPVVWPDDMGLSHKDVARSVFTGRPLSAGFALLETWDTQGNSISLGLAPAAGDADLLRKHFTRCTDQAPLLKTPIAESSSAYLTCPTCGWKSFIALPLQRCNRPGPLVCRGIFPKKP
jgi:hypothetical protein